MTCGADGSGSARARTYDNSRRRAEVERQRSALIDALAAQLGQRDVTELSLASAADAAGVSLRTAHRYFPTRESRLAALAVHVDEQLGPIDHRLETVDDIPGFIRAAYRRAERNWAVTRALYRSAVGDQVRVRYLAGRRQRYAELLHTIGAPAKATRRASVAVSLLASSEAGMPLVDIHGLTAREAGEVAAQTAAAVIADLRTLAAPTPSTNRATNRATTSGARTEG
jgi:AcrR family transcriptional regulator